MKRATSAIQGTILVLLVGCGGDMSTEASAQLSVMGADTLAFEPAEFTIPAGEPVTLALTAGEAVDHDFVVGGAANVGVVREDEGRSHEGQAITSGDLPVVHAEPGATATTTLTVNKPGTYQVYCSVAGHRESGMIATLTVVEDR